ncbi:MAG: WbqC family protein [bacterium]
MIVAVHQPQFMPWLGYFHKMQAADVFVLLDNVQFKKNEWQNRNRIKTAQGWQWLTVPVHHRFGQKINETRICYGSPWHAKHLKSLETNYRRSPYFEAYFERISSIYGEHFRSLSELNILVIRELSALLHIDTPLIVASELGEFPADADERLIELTRYFGGDTYLAGVGGLSYMNLDKYKRAGISVKFQSFLHPQYPQLYGQFFPGLSVVDLLFNCGVSSLHILTKDKEELYEHSGNWVPSG